MTSYPNTHPKTKQALYPDLGDNTKFPKNIKCRLTTLGFFAPVGSARIPYLREWIAALEARLQLILHYKLNHKTTSCHRHNHILWKGQKFQ